ncbi:MAG TPA: hypothetical protein VGK59_20580 [Ohtaekwangia sp.]
MRIQAIFPVLLIISAFACKKPVDSTYESAFNEPVIFSTSLDDTISSETLTMLKLNRVNGIKVKYRSGQYASYFEYEADHHFLIRTIGSLPFPMSAVQSDTTCHPLPIRYLETVRNTLSETEISGSAFWSVNPEEYTAYECLKAPFKHTILLSRSTKKVLHRIEFVG